MNKSIEIIKNTRIFLLDVIKDLSVEQINQIPQGFNNNIAWNLAHMISAQQGICYVRAGLSIVVDDKYFTPYRPGTKPDQFIDSSEYKSITHLLLSSIDQLETDYNNNLFANYTPWTARYGVEMTSIDDALNFLPYHDGLHVGYIMALKRLVN